MVVGSVRSDVLRSKCNEPESNVVTYTDENKPKEVNAWDLMSKSTNISKGQRCKLWIAHSDPVEAKSRPV